MKVFFCDPFPLWQIGTNENANDLLRQFFSKGSSFIDVYENDLQLVVNLINNRHRKRLHYRTPTEVLSRFY